MYSKMYMYLQKLQLFLKILVTDIQVTNITNKSF